MLINPAPTENVEGKSLEVVENDYYMSMAQALARLKQNEDFKKLILEGYFKDKAIRGVEIMATDYARVNNLRGAIMEELNGISMLKDYFLTVESLGMKPADDEEESEE